jgi:hypothetical protein
MVYVLVTPRVIVNREEACQASMPCCKEACQASMPCCKEACQLPMPCCKEACGQCKLAREKGAEVIMVSAEASEPCGTARALAELLRAYDEACAAGRTQEAARLAQAALVLDPTCFARRHGR